MDDFVKDYAMAKLCHQINESEFNKLEVTKVEEGLSVSMDGQTFGIIGALGVAVADLSLSADMTIDEAISFVRMSAELAIQCRQPDEKDCTVSTEKFLNFMQSIFKKEGDK